ncbi:MAG: hypothetical protein WAK67_12760 [Xanthobacteraceae bacterium]
MTAAVLVFVAMLVLTLHPWSVSGAISMTIRTSSKTVSFARPFLLKGVDRVLAAGQYKVITDEELIEELSFPVYRRVATMIFVPADSQNSSSVEMVAIDPRDLQDAQDRDAEAP